MLSLFTLIEMSNNGNKERSGTVASKVLNCTLGQDEDGVFKQVTCVAVSDTIPRTIVWRLYQTRNKAFTINSLTWVHCGCEDWTYRWEVADTIRGSSSVINSNGAMPRIRNARTRPGLCKHALACARQALTAKPEIAGKRMTKPKTKQIKPKVL